MPDIATWLASLGLSEYTECFAANDIDLSVLNHLSDQYLKEIGVSLGHRRKILAAIAERGKIPLARLKPQEAAERRQLTLMFCDLMGSTALSARLDPEDLRDIIRNYQLRCAQLVAKSGGFVAQYLGDGILAYFGYPQAHEDDAELAVKTGLEMIRVVERLRTQAPEPLKVRIGVATGLVVVGDLIGDRTAQEQGVVGETPNLAARLQSIAEPSTIVIDPSTRRLLADLFEYRNLGPVSVKGFASPVQAYQVVRSSSVESRFEALRTTTTPLVGREEEIELLMRRWHQAKEGDGQVVLICGEPGIGKSRIAKAAQDRLGGEPYTALRYFCSPHHQESALYPFIAQFERAAGFRRDDASEQRLVKLESVLAQAGGDLSEAVPLIADMLSIPAAERYPPLDLTAQKRREKSLKTLLGQLQGLAARQPVLMVFEDIHWIDPTSLEALDLIIDHIPRLRVVLVITFRPEFTPPWVGSPQVTLLSLNRLPPRQRAEMISGMLSGKALPKEIADQIIDRTDGIPLFIEELTKAVIESGMIANVGDGYKVCRPLTPLAIPTSLQGSLLARLDRLAPVREVAQIAAVLDRQFSHELISAVAPMSQQQLDEALDQLERAELIFRHGTAPEADYTFKHVLVQDVAYSTLLRSRRQQLHARIASTLESQFPEMVAAQPQLMARHCAEAGLAEKAVHYWLKAGQRAVARSAMTEAIVQLQKGLELLTEVADAPERQQLELDLRIALGQALIATRGYAASTVGEASARARSLAEQLNRSEYLVPLLYVQWAFHLTQAKHKLALSHAREIERIGKAQKVESILWLGHYLRGLSRFFLGEFATARLLLEQCYAERDQAHRKDFAALTSADPHVVSVACLALTLTILGYMDQGRARLSEALLEARRLGHTYTLVWVLVYACRAEWLFGSPQATGRYAEEVVALSREHGFALWMSWGLVLQGWSLSALGQTLEGVGLLTKGLSAARETGAVAHTPTALGMLAEMYAKLGQVADGLGCLAEALEIVDRSNERYAEAELYRLRGELLSMIGENAAAEANYSRALAIAERQSAEVFRLRAASSLAALRRDQGRRDGTRDLLVPVYAWFTEGRDTPVLKNAEALLGSLPE